MRWQDENNYFPIIMVPPTQEIYWFHPAIS